MPLNSFFVREQHHVVLSSIQGSVSRSGLPVPDSRLKVLRLAECGLRDFLALIELRKGFGKETG